MDICGRFIAGPGMEWCVTLAPGVLVNATRRSFDFAQDDIGGVQGDVKNVRGDMVFEVTGAGVVVGARVDPSTSLRMT